MVTFTNPRAPLFSQGDWFRMVLVMCVISVAPVVYVIGSHFARQQPSSPGTETTAIGIAPGALGVRWPTIVGAAPWSA